MNDSVVAIPQEYYAVASSAAIAILRQALVFALAIPSTPLPAQSLAFSVVWPANFATRLGLEPRATGRALACSPRVAWSGCRAVGMVPAAMAFALRVPAVMLESPVMFNALALLDLLVADMAHAFDPLARAHASPIRPPVFSLDLIAASASAVGAVHRALYLAL